MTQTTIYHGITGILRPFKEYLAEKGLKSGDQIVYYGCAGTCTPFVELLAVAVRGQHYEQVYVPLLEEMKAKILHEVPDAGMQVSNVARELRPRVLVFMGGLAMPHMPVTKEQIKDLVARHPDVIIAGVCFMSMFEKAGWLDTVTFDLLIDGTLDPVTVTRND
ncbi:MAG TPA: DUF2124 domain-containing protein [Methanoregulaceae archaeon]|nr:DUF2124 domain-containing protein [Methanoregulaceae archaeon]